MSRTADVSTTGVDRYEPGLRTPPEVLDEIRELIAACLGHAPPSASLLVGWNTDGARPPLFWSARSYAELSDFAARVGDDQPVYGMRSLAGTRSENADNSTALTRRYTAEILDIQPDGPLLLGGHFEGAGVAFRIARALRSRGREVASLCLVEHYTPEAYDSRTAFFFNVSGASHPFHDPDSPWRALFSGPLRLHPSRTAAENVYTDLNTITAIRRELSEAARCDQPRHPAIAGRVTGPNSEGTKGRRSPVRLKSRPPRITTSDQDITIAVEVENRGDVALPAGTRIYDRWRRVGTRPRLFDSYATLDDELPSGQRTRIHLRVRLPLTPGLWILDFDIAPEADMHFVARPATGTRSVLLLPGRAVVSHLQRHLPWTTR